jgi:hypothetical protein
VAVLSKSEEDEPREPDEHERMLSWIEERLREAGYNRYQAAALAEAGVDWHQALALVRDGCDHATAVDILL